MADFDINANGYGYGVQNRSQYSELQSPTVAALKTAMTTFQAGTYTTQANNLLSKNDLIFAARSNAVAVAGI